MKNIFIQFRNAIIHTIYRFILKPIFFRYDAEMVHDSMTNLGIQLGKYGLFRFITRCLFGYSDPILSQKILGITFINPVGLSAGFDKNAELTNIIPSVGFGFEEVGSVTGEPCAGNPKPRLWRLRKSKGLVVHYGLKNDGCEVVAKRLRNALSYNDSLTKNNENNVGTSVAMTNCQANLDIDMAVADYVKAFRAFTDIGSYYTINISCPNTIGGQPFVIPANLDRLLEAIDKVPTTKPVFIKFSPDISFGQVDAILEVAKKHRVHGIITTNLTKKRNNPGLTDAYIPTLGGVSGKPVQRLSDAMLPYIYKKEGKRFVLIGTGGIFSAEDAYAKIRLGASLVQMLTGMVFQGPQVVSEINRGLALLLKRDGFKNIHDAIGVDVDVVAVDRVHNA